MNSQIEEEISKIRRDIVALSQDFQNKAAQNANSTNSLRCKFKKKHFIL
jgi:hypothetical protein